MTIKHNRWMLPTGLILLVLLTVVICLLVGSTSISPALLWQALCGEQAAETQRIILFSIRLPRALAAVTAGMGLALAGVLLQTVMANPLASPNTVGVSAGGGLGALVCMWLCPVISLLPFAAFIGAFLTALLIVAVAKVMGGERGSVILAGIACTTFFQALISLGVSLDSDVLSLYNDFAVGTLSGVRLEQLWIPLALILGSLAVCLCLSGRIATLPLGDRAAAGLGNRVFLLRTLCLLLASMSAAAVISFAGLLGFVGLVVPHITRKLFGTELRTQLFTAPLCGAILVLLSDLVGRTLFAPSEISVGIVMALIGAPFFFVLLLGGGKNCA